MTCEVKVYVDRQYCIKSIRGSTIQLLLYAEVIAIKAGYISKAKTVALCDRCYVDQK